MFNLQAFLDLINSKYCTHEYNILNFSDLEKVDKTFFKITKYQSEKKHIFLAKEFWSQCHILRIIYVLYMYYICIIYVLYVYYMCFCWLYLAFLGFFASAAFFVCAFAGFIWLFLGFLRPRRFLSVLLLAFPGFWCPRRFLYGGRHANDAVDHSLLWQPHHWQSSAERCKTPRRPANDTVCHGPRRQPYHSHASAAFSDPWNCRARPVNDTEAAGAQCEVCCGTQSRLNGNPAP